MLFASLAPQTAPEPVEELCVPILAIQ